MLNQLKKVFQNEALCAIVAAVTAVAVVSPLIIGFVKGPEAVLPYLAVFLEVVSFVAVAATAGGFIVSQVFNRLLDWAHSVVPEKPASLKDNNIHIRIADFSPVPMGRTPADGAKNAETFRDTILVPALCRAESIGVMVDVSLDGVEGVASSWLDEAFAHLTRIQQYDYDRLRALLKVTTTDAALQSCVELIWEFVKEAADEPPSRVAS